MDLVLAVGAKEVGLLQTIIAGGVPLVLAVLVAIEGFVIYLLWKEIKTLRDKHQEFLEKQIGKVAENQAVLTEQITRSSDFVARAETALNEANKTMTRQGAKLDEAGRRNSS